VSLNLLERVRASLPLRKQEQLPAPSSRELAAQTFAALRALDVSASERAELEAEGIAQHTIDALYPPSFTSMLTNLQAVLDVRAIPPLLLAMKGTELSVHIRRGNQLATEVRNGGHSWSAQHPHNPSTDDVHAFHDHVGNLLGGGEKADKFASRCVSLLWDAWWLMENRHLLDPEGVKEAEVITSWAGSKLFPVLLQGASTRR
jgi:hypothetical protein